jgi:putative tricarboxylic transport membrane protein
MLLLIAPVLAAFALKFGPAEYFILAVMGLASIVTLTSENLLKGLISGLLGLIIATIGTDPISGEWHYTFGFYELVEGVSFMPALIGLFSITQMLSLTEKSRIAKDSVNIKSIKREKMPKKLGPFIGIGSITGTIIGILPGAGATIAGFVSYNLAKQHSKNKELFGKGNVEGIAASESGNNGCVGGSLVPLLTLGIPGNTVAAALMGGLIINGLIPGPELFTTNGSITYAYKNQ